MRRTSDINFAVSPCSRPVRTTRLSHTPKIHENSPESRKRHGRIPRKRRSKNLHNSATTMDLRAPDTGAPGANSPREFGRLVSRGRALRIRGGSRTRGVALPTPSFRRLSVGADFLSTSADPSLAGPDPVRARLHAGCLPPSRQYAHCLRRQGLQGECGGGPEPRRQVEQAGCQTHGEAARVLRPRACGHRRCGHGPGGAGHQEAPERDCHRESQGRQSGPSRRGWGRGRREEDRRAPATFSTLQFCNRPRTGPSA